MLGQVEHRVAQGQHFESIECRADDVRRHGVRRDLEVAEPDGERGQRVQHRQSEAGRSGTAGAVRTAFDDQKAITDDLRKDIEAAPAAGVTDAEAIRSVLVAATADVQTTINLNQADAASHPDSDYEFQAVKEDRLFVGTEKSLSQILKPLDEQSRADDVPDLGGDVRQDVARLQAEGGVEVAGAEALEVESHVAVPCGLHGGDDVFGGHERAQVLERKLDAGRIAVTAHAHLTEPEHV